MKRTAIGSASRNDLDTAYEYRGTQPHFDSGDSISLTAAEARLLVEAGVQIAASDGIFAQGNGTDPDTDLDDLFFLGVDEVISLHAPARQFGSAAAQRTRARVAGGLPRGRRLPSQRIAPILVSSRANRRKPPTTRAT